MNQTVENLVKVLEKEDALYGELDKLLVEELEVLRKLNMSRIEEILGQKAILLGHVHRLETERATLMLRLATEQGISNENPRLHELVRRIPAPWAGRLLDLRKRLRARIENVNERATWNGQYVQGFVQVMDGVMESLRAAVAGPGVYGKSGQAGRNGVVSGELLRQAI